MHRIAKDMGRLTKQVNGLLSLVEERAEEVAEGLRDHVEEAREDLASDVESLRLSVEELDERTTTLSIGAGNVAEALERTEALTDKLEALENRAKLLEAMMAKSARVRVADAMGLAGPALAWVKGEISTGRWAEVLEAWANGKRQWVAEDVGLPHWPEPPPWMGEEDIPW